MKIDKLFIHINLNFKSTTDGRGRVLTGISPRHGFHAALPIACDALPNIVRLYARTVAVREYQYTDLYVIARKPPRLHYGVVLSLRFPRRGKYHGAQAARLCI